MKPFRVIQFGATVALLCTGCAALAFHVFNVLTLICLFSPGIFRIWRSEHSRPMSNREFVSLLIALLFWIFVGTAGARVVFHPAFIVPLWVLMMFVLFWQWRKERRLTDA